MTRIGHRSVMGRGVSAWVGEEELMGQTAKRAITVTVDLGGTESALAGLVSGPRHHAEPCSTECPSAGYGSERTRPSAPRLHVKRERATARVEVHLTTSELAGLKRMAGHEGYLPTKWVVVMVRTRLTGEPHVGQPELEEVVRSKQQLLALGRNLNQIVKV